MVFNEDDETRTAENRSRLMYSILNSETKSWSKPIAVKDDKTADYGFDIYDDGKDIYIVWQNADEILKEGYSLSETAKHLGISIAKYDCKEGKMIFLENVADTLNDEQCQMEPHIVSNDGHIYVCWYENSNNNVFGTSGINTIYYKEIFRPGPVSRIVLDGGGRDAGRRAGRRSQRAFPFPYSRFLPQEPFHAATFFGTD